MFLSLAEFKKEGALKKERAFPCIPFRKKKLLNSKRESTRLVFTNGPSPTLRLKTVPSFLVPPLVPPNCQAEDGAVSGGVGPAIEGCAL